MAKRIAFLLIMMFILLLATVTSFAAETESTTPEAGFTEDEANRREEVSVSDLEKKYGDILFAENSESDKKIIVVGYERAISVENPLRHTFTGAVDGSSSDIANPVVMLMYIKVDGEYVPLLDIDTEKNMTDGVLVTNSTVDLKYLGSDKVNEVRVIAFRKSDAKKLQLNANVQITDLEITVRPLGLIEKVKITYNEFMNNLTTP